MRHARVFISCGQKTNKEKGIGETVAGYFRERGFETYFAERVHSSDALTENIFKFLRQSEYFVFIDFKRGKINQKESRGSLFVNQEIAIATFLRLEGMGFYKRGVKREGIRSYQIYNARPFKHEKEIIKALEKETREWDVNWINELKIMCDPTITRNVRVPAKKQKVGSDWYHLVVKNHHKSKHAFLCSGYVTRIKNLRNGKVHEIPTNELIWAGTKDIVVNIMADTKRELDAFHVVHDENKIYFHQRSVTRRSRYILPDLPQGKYLIEYTIISSNFKTASRNFVLEFLDSGKDVVFRVKR